MNMELHLLQTGDELPVHHSGPITRSTLALFAGGSGDHMPIHIDIDAARRFGIDDVFAHGMLSMAYLGQLLVRISPQETIRSYKVRFTSITPVGTHVKCHAKVLERIEQGGETLLRLVLQTQIDDGTVTMEGEAVIALT